MCCFLVGELNINLKINGTINANGTRCFALHVKLNINTHYFDKDHRRRTKKQNAMNITAKIDNNTAASNDFDFGGDCRS